MTSWEKRLSYANSVPQFRRLLVAPLYEMFSATPEPQDPTCSARSVDDLADLVPGEHPPRLNAII